MYINPKTGLLSGAKFVQSPNYDERPSGEVIDLIVIHNISLPPNQFGGPYIEALFLNKLNPKEHPYFNEIAHIKVSAHCLIRRDGSIIQFVPFHLRAWHAGKSFFLGRERCNDFSIGIELEGADEVPYAKEQYHSLIELLSELMRTYPKITEGRIVGHQTIAPDRKTDPGPAFNWELLATMLKNRIG